MKLQHWRKQIVAQSFWQFSFRWGNGTAVYGALKFPFCAECKSLRLYMNPMFVPRIELDSLFNNYISRKSKWSSAYVVLYPYSSSCTVSSTWPLVLLNTDLTAFAHSSFEAWNRLLPYRSSPQLTSETTSSIFLLVRHVSQYQRKTK